MPLLNPLMERSLLIYSYSDNHHLGNRSSGHMPQAESLRMSGQHSVFVKRRHARAEVMSRLDTLQSTA